MKGIGIVLFFLLLSCGTSKIDEDVTLHKRPVYRMSEAKKNQPRKINSVAEKTSSKKDTNFSEKTDTSTENNMPPNSVVVTASPYNKNKFSDSQRVKEIMAFLASDELKGRDSGSEGIEMAADYIENFFGRNHIAPYFDSYRDTLFNVDPAAFNVVGYLEGNDKRLKEEFIVIGAHYDHIGVIAAVGGDDIANGANDNASGTATVLELARYFGTTKTNKRSIIFALFSAEEKGLLGSKHLAKKLKAENLDLYAMLNFEMVGVPLVDKNYLMYVTGYQESNLAGVSNMFVGFNLVGYLPQAKEFDLFKRSDNYPFYTEFNVPSQTFSTFDFTNFDYYHQVDDEAEAMDFEHMAMLINKTVPLVESLANSMTKMVKLR